MTDHRFPRIQGELGYHGLIAITSAFRRTAYKSPQMDGDLRYLEALEEALGEIPQDRQSKGRDSEVVDAGAREAIRILASERLPDAFSHGGSVYLEKLKVIAEHGAYPPEPPAERPIQA